MRLGLCFSSLPISKTPKRSVTDLTERERQGIASDYEASELQLARRFCTPVLANMLSRWTSPMHKSFCTCGLDEPRADAAPLA